ncbi:13562_t:CDS:2, partial [Gigaspora rosea]
FENDQRLPKSTQKAKDSIGNTGFLAFLERIYSEGVKKGGTLKKTETQLVVFSLDICANNNKTKELTKDLLSIITVFVMQHNKLCFATNCKKKETTQAIQKFQEGSNKTSSRQ